MQTIHKIAKVINNQVIIDLPPHFRADEVEVFIKPLIENDSEISDIESEIDIGIKSPVSSHTHEEIFRKLRRKYESS